MSDNQQQPTSGGDSLSTLDELLAKAKAKRQPPEPPEDSLSGVSTGPELSGEPQGPLPEDLVAQQQAELAVREEQAETERLQQLQQQQQKMLELKETPQFQARQEQDSVAAAEAAQQTAEQQGHVIHQVSDTKI